jgi:hypothetical protein
VFQIQVGDQLTETQQRILAALVRPMREGSPYETPATNREIADEVFLSVDAVKGHLRALYAKFYLADLPQNAKRARLAEIALSGQIDPPEPRPPARIPVIGRAPSLAGSSLLVVASVLMLVGLGWAAGIGKQEAADRFAAAPPAQDAPGAGPTERAPTQDDRDRARDRFEFSDGDVIGGFAQETGGSPIVEDLGSVPVPVSYEQDLPIAGDEPGRGRGPVRKVKGKLKKVAKRAPAAVPALPAPAQAAVPPAKPVCTTTRHVVTGRRVSYRRKVVRVPRVSYVRRTRIHLHVRRVRVRVPVVVRWTTRTRRGKLRRHQRVEYRWVWRRKTIRHPHVRRVRVVRMVRRVRRVRVVTPTRRVRTVRRCG